MTTTINGSARKALDGALCYTEPGYRAAQHRGQTLDEAEEHVRPVVREHECSAAQLRVLRVIIEQPGVSMTELRTATGGTEIYLWGVLQQLHVRRWIASEQHVNRTSSTKRARTTYTALVDVA